MAARFMIIDDDDYRGMLVRDVFHRLGHPSHVFLDPDIALDALQDRPGGYAAVIVSGRLCERLGNSSFADEAAARSPGTRVFAIRTAALEAGLGD